MSEYLSHFSNTRAGGGPHGGRRGVGEARRDGLLPLLHPRDGAQQGAP